MKARGLAVILAIIFASLPYHGFEPLQNSDAQYALVRRTERTQETPESTQGEASREAPEETPEETAEPTPEETPEPTPEETAEPTPEETPDPTPEETAEPTPEETPEPTPEETPKPTPDPTPEETTEPTTEPETMQVSRQTQEQKEATYTVVYRLENADYDNAYLSEERRDKERYADWEAETFTGCPGEIASVTPPEIPGFTARTEQKVIGEDGSTVVYVYYDRNVYTLTFRDRTDSRTVYSLTAKYGAQLDYHWPYADSWSGATYWLLGLDDGGPRQTRLAVMPLGDRTYYQPNYNERTATSDYYLEVSPEEEGEGDLVERDGRFYRLAGENTCGAVGENRSTVGEEDFYEIPGYEADRSRSAQTGDAYDGAGFFYNRRAYAVVLHEGETVERVWVPYGEEMTGILERTIPAGTVQTLPDGRTRTFLGWYARADCEGTPLDLTGRRMPARNFVVYAKWAVEEQEGAPSAVPTAERTAKPTAAPTIAPAAEPTAAPMQAPSSASDAAKAQKGRAEKESASTAAPKQTPGVCACCKGNCCRHP